SPSLIGCALTFGGLVFWTIQADADTIVLPTFDVVATTPLGGGEIDVSKVPGAVWQTGAQEIQSFNDTTTTETLARQAPGVTVGNVSGNDFQPDVSFRDFDATAARGATCASCTGAPADSGSGRACAASSPASASDDGRGPA